MFEIVQFKHEGDTLAARGTLNQVFARIYMTADTLDELAKTIGFVKQTLKITDDRQENMILHLFDECQLLEH